MTRILALLSALLVAVAIGFLVHLPRPLPELPQAAYAAHTGWLQHAFIDEHARPPATQARPPQAQPQAALPAALREPIVRVKARSVANARSNAELGREREGTGVVVDRDGYIVTSLFVVQEPDAIEVTTSKDRTVPATLVSQDEKSGVAILKATLPLQVDPMTLGDASTLATREPVLVISAARQPEIAYVVARREFAGTWEYLVDNAIIIAPATPGWAGAALVNSGGGLIGIGLLLVNNALAGHHGRVPGNMFVPIDTVKPVLEAARKGGGESARVPLPWLGLVTQEIAGRLIVSEVPPESPAERAGLRQGDIILAVGPQEITNHGDLYRRIWDGGRPGGEVPLTVLRGTRVQQLSLRAIDAREYLAQKASL